MLSLYIHIPFCVRKCHYCGFYSTTYSPQASEPFIAALDAEVSACLPEFEMRVFDNIYIGGGTPTALSFQEIEKVLTVTRQFNVSKEAEFTIEVNPNSLSMNHLAVCREQGVNRISLGVQSFDDRLLKVLGRSHTAKQAVDAFKLARTAGIKNLSVDLIFGIPGQTLEQWHKDLEHVRVLDPEHLSVYSLSIDNGSEFNEQAEKGTFILPDDETTAALYETATEKLEQAGFVQYEVSNFSKPGFACRHNMNYWNRGEYLGLGPGAWSFINNIRRHNIADVGEYARRLRVGQSVCEGSETVNSGEAATEMVMLALRTSRGLDLERYCREFGSDAFARLMVRTKQLQRSDLLIQNKGRIRLTRRGFLVSNEVLNRLCS